MSLISSSNDKEVHVGLYIQFLKDRIKKPEILC